MPARLLTSIRPYICCALAPFLLTVAGPAFAQDQTPKAPPEPAATRIEVDQRANVIRFFIDGKESARLDATGLHVRENVSYGGSINYYGPTGFDVHAGAHMGEQVSENGEDGDAR